MAGILYLFRLFIYDKEFGENNKDNHRLLQLMQKRLYSIITVPAMLLSWAFGLSMLKLNPIILKQGWFHAKLACLILLTISTFYCGFLKTQSSENVRSLPSSKKLRFFNEIPTLLMIIIVGLAILKPF